jgi:hypothetical protein
MTPKRFVFVEATAMKSLPRAGRAGTYDLRVIGHVDNDGPKEMGRV